MTEILWFACGAALSWLIARKERIYWRNAAALWKGFAEGQQLRITALNEALEQANVVIRVSNTLNSDIPERITWLNERPDDANRMN